MMYVKLMSNLTQDDSSNLHLSYQLYSLLISFMSIHKNNSCLNFRSLYFTEDDQRSTSQNRNPEIYVKLQYLYMYITCNIMGRSEINFTSCSENGNEIARGAAECYFAVIATTSGIYPKTSLLPVLSQINTIASFVKVKISNFQTRFHNE